MDNDLVHYMLIYNYCDDMANKRIPLNKAHWTYQLKYRETGVLFEGGPFTDGTGAIFIVKHNKKDKTTHPEYIAKNDPFYLNNLITGYQIKEYNFTTLDMLKSKIANC